MAVLNIRGAVMRSMPATKRSAKTVRIRAVRAQVGAVVSEPAPGKGIPEASRRHGSQLNQECEDVVNL